mgnify:CR=1 FL=1
MTDTLCSIFSQEEFVSNVQVALHTAIEESGITRQQLATKMGVHIVTLNRMFGAGHNLTVRRVAEICYHLGIKPEMVIK